MIILTCKTSQKRKLHYNYAVVFWKIDENYARNYAKDMLAQFIKAYPGYGSRITIHPYYMYRDCACTARYAPINVKPAGGGEAGHGVGI